MGVLGGTFDPIHLGHIACAREVTKALSLEKMLLVLSARPPHKGEGSQASIEHRWEMLLRATIADPDLEPCDLEINRGGPSYTTETLEELAALHPRHELYLIVGIDAYREIDTWHHPERLLQTASMLVTSRPGHAFAAGTPVPPIAAAGSCCYDPRIGCYVHSTGHQLTGHRIHGLDVSASQIRRRVAQGLAVDDLTGPEVARYIRDHGLYGAPSL